MLRCDHKEWERANDIYKHARAFFCYLGVNEFLKGFIKELKFMYRGEFECYYCGHRINVGDTACPNKECESNNETC